MAHLLHSKFFYYSVLFVYTVVVHSLETAPTPSTTASPIWVPRFEDQFIPASPVNYVFAGDDEEVICLLLLRSITAVVYAEVSNTSLEYSVDSPPDVPIELIQTMGPCDHDTSLTCISLLITTASDNLPEGQFRAYYDGKVVTISYGPFGFTNPSGGDEIPFSTTYIRASLLYRPKRRSREDFIVCKNGSFADFVVTVLMQPHCRQGSGAGGYSTPFVVKVDYVGSFPIDGREFIITSETCEDPEAGVVLPFTIPELVTSSVGTIWSTATATTISHSTIASHSIAMATPTPTFSAVPPADHSRLIAAAVVTPVLIVLVIVIVMVVICVYKRRGFYRLKRIGQERTSFKDVASNHTDEVGPTERQPDEVERAPQNEQDGSFPPNLIAESLEALSDPTHTSTPKKEFNSTDNIERSPHHLDQSGASPVRLSTDPITRKKPEKIDVMLNASDGVDVPKDQINSSRTDPTVRKMQNDIEKLKDSMEEVAVKVEVVAKKVEKVDRVAEKVEKVDVLVEKVDRVAEKVEKVCKNSSNTIVGIYQLLDGISDRMDQEKLADGEVQEIEAEGYVHPDHVETGQLTRQEVINDENNDPGSRP